MSDSVIQPRSIEDMTNLLHHRGPDNYGYALFGSNCQSIYSGREPRDCKEAAAVALGHRRLSIIDVKPTSWQPMRTPDGRFWITYNGEVYNYIELRQELKSLGYSFLSTGDTEVILHAYQQWGEECVQKFNGMWAFAIWDCHKCELFCSRDRLGVKPFYYYQSERQFVFASEMKAVAAAIDRSQRSLNRPYITRFIVHGLLNDGSETFFGKIHQLLPAHCLRIKLIRSSGQLTASATSWRYWDLPSSVVSRANQGVCDVRFAVEEFRELLNDAIQLRFRADVPVGVSLSGGLDSSSIVAQATRALKARLLSFTVEYNEPDVAEGHYARQVARVFDTQEHYYTPGPSDYIDFIDRFCFYHDEPCPGPGPFSQWNVMRLAHNRVKVILDGQGADELLGGYHHYFNYYLVSLFRRMFSLGPARQTLKQYMTESRAIRFHLSQTRRQSGLTALKHLATRYLTGKAGCLLRGAMGDRSSQLHQVIRPQWQSSLGTLYHPWRPRFKDDLNDILYRELTRDNLPMLLQFNDRTSMSFSLESRVPFLDYRLVEWVSSLPYTLKIRSQWTKYILREAMRDTLPAEIAFRTDKKGYSTPFNAWLKGPLKSYLFDLINSQSLKQRGIFNPDQVQKVFQQHIDGVADHSWLLWRIIDVERWMQIYQDDFDSICQLHRQKQFPVAR